MMHGPCLTRWGMNLQGDKGLMGAQLASLVNQQPGPECREPSRRQPRSDLKKPDNP
jgi:hypothetical protein